MVLKRACVSFHYGWEKQLQQKESNYDTRHRQQRASETINTRGGTERVRKHNEEDLRAKKSAATTSRTQLKVIVLSVFDLLSN